ncbi:hypothetical protein QTN25_008772 [Entamoeba marina]
MSTDPNCEVLHLGFVNTASMYDSLDGNGLSLNHPSTSFDSSDSLSPQFDHPNASNSNSHTSDIIKSNDNSDSFPNNVFVHHCVSETNTQRRYFIGKQRAGSNLTKSISSDTLTVPSQNKSMDEIQQELNAKLHKLDKHVSSDNININAKTAVIIKRRPLGARQREPLTKSVL